MKRSHLIHLLRAFSFIAAMTMAFASPFAHAAGTVIPEDEGAGAQNLLEMLRSDDATVRLAGTQQVREMSHEAKLGLAEVVYDRLIELLTDENPDVRLSAKACLTDASFVIRMVNELANEDANIQLRALARLKRMNTEADLEPSDAAVDKVILLLRIRDSRVPPAAEGYLTSPKFITRLLGELEDASPVVRLTAIRRIREIGRTVKSWPPQAVLARLITILSDDGESSIRYATAIFLTSPELLSTDEVKAALDKVRAQLLGAMNAPARPTLNLEAARALIRLRTKLDDSQHTQMNSVFLTLWNLDDAGPREELLRLFVRALHADSSLPGTTDEVLFHLCTMLRHPDQRLRLFALNVLFGSLGGEAPNAYKQKVAATCLNDIVVACTRDPNVIVRMEAAGVLAQLHSVVVGAIDGLIDMLKNDPDELVRSRVARLLGTIAENDLDNRRKVAEVFRDRLGIEGSSRALAAIAFNLLFCKSDAQDAVPNLIAILNSNVTPNSDPNVQESAAYALGHIPPRPQDAPGAVSVLFKVFQSNGSNSELGDRAYSSLNRLAGYAAQDGETGAALRPLLIQELPNLRRQIPGDELIRKIEALKDWKPKEEGEESGENTEESETDAARFESEIEELFIEQLTDELLEMRVTDEELGVLHPASPPEG